MKSSAPLPNPSVQLASSSPWIQESPSADVALLHRGCQLLQAHLNAWRQCITLQSGLDQRSAVRCVFGKGRILSQVMTADRLAPHQGIVGTA
jgi:hypothetical protein